MCASCPTELARDLDGAYARFVEHHQDLVYGMAFRGAGRDDAQDIAQEAFLRAWKALRGYQRDRIADLRARGWLARIVLNLVRNRARDTGPRTDPLDPPNVPAHDPPAPAADGPEAVAARRDALRAWAGLLAGLPLRYRLAVELRHVEGLSYDELAVALARPVGTVKSDVHRGVRLLRAAYLADTEGRGTLPVALAEVAR